MGGSRQWEVGSWKWAVGSWSEATSRLAQRFGRAVGSGQLIVGSGKLERSDIPISAAIREGSWEWAVLRRNEGQNTDR